MRAKETRPENPDRHPRSLAGNRAHFLPNLAGLEERDQLGDVVRERIDDGGIAAQRVRRDLIRARRATEAEIDATGKQRLQGAELFGDD